MFMTIPQPHVNSLLSIMTLNGYGMLDEQNKTGLNRPSQHSGGVFGSKNTCIRIGWEMDYKCRFLGPC